MAQIAILNNSDPNVDAKANFFADYFHFYATVLGVTAEFELETPLSLVDKICYQLEHNIKNCGQYIRTFLLHDYLSGNKVYLKGYTSYARVEEVIYGWQSFKSKDFIDKQREWLDAFWLFNEELSKNMFTKSLDSIINILTCGHPVTEHIEDIKVHTKILVSAYIFFGRDKAYLGEVFQFILSKDIHEFPFPKDITTDKQKEVFIAERSLEKQFRAIFDHLSAKIVDATYYYKVYGADFPAQFMLRYNNVVFYSREHVHVKEILETDENEVIETNFFLAEVTVRYFSSALAEKEARRQIQEEVRYLTSLLKRDFIVDNQHNYFVQFDNLISPAWSSHKLMHRYEAEDLSKLKHNPHEQLRETYSLASDHVRSFEHLLVAAALDNSIPGYWHYLEAMFSVYKQEDKLKDVLSTIVLINEQEIRRSLITEQLSSMFSFMHFPRHRFAMSVQEAHTISVDLYNGKVPEAVRKLDYPLIIELLTYHDKALTAADYKAAKDYYYRLLTEGYMQRNTYIHQGKSQREAHLKLLHSFPDFIRRVRHLLFNAIRDRKSGFNFKEVVEDLLTKGSDLLLVHE